MADRAELRRDGTVLLVDLHELEEDVRRARVSPDEMVHYGPWTGEGYKKVAEIAELADALDSPDARFHAHLLSRRFPWLTLALVAVLVLAGVVQFAGEMIAREHADRVIHLLAVGWEPSVLDMAAWGPLTAQFVHANPFHLVGNLAVIAYCSFRCERAVGRAGLLGILAASVAGGAALIVAFSELPCIGSSIIGFGLWGAQFAIGWRYNDWIPQARRGNYGFGTVVLTIPMLVESFTSPQVSFLGHLGGWLGGILAAMAFPLPTAAPRARANATSLAAVAAATLTLVAPVATCVLLGALPTVNGFPAERASVGESGLSLSLPWRMLTHPGRAVGMAAWAPSPSFYAPLYATVVQVDHPGLPTMEELRLGWEQRLGGTVESITPVLSREGWTAFGWRGTNENGDTWEAQEALRARGWQTARVGYYTEEGASWARVKAYQAVLDSAEWADPPELAEKEANYKRWPDDPEFVYRYGYALEEVGRVGEAMAIYAKLAARDDGWEWNAARARMRVCAWSPSTEGCDTSWRDQWLETAPPADQRIWIPAIQWAAGQGDCARAYAWGRRVAMDGDVAYAEVERVLGSCRDWVSPEEAALIGGTEAGP